MIRFAAERDLQPDAAAQVLARALAIQRTLADDVRRELAAAVRSANSPGEGYAAARRTIDRHKVALVEAIAAAQLAAALAGAGRAAERLPGYSAPVEADLQPAPLPPWQAESLAVSLRGLPPPMQSAYLLAMTPDAAAQVRRLLGDAAPPDGPFNPAGVGATEPPDGFRLPLIDAAVEDLRRRRLLTRPEYDALAVEARARAFTVAGVEEQAVLAKIQEALTETVREGASLKVFREKMDANTAEGTFLSDAHMETVYRTNVQTAYGRGMDAVLDNPVVGEAFPYEETLPIRDSRLTDLCSVVSRSGLGGTGVFRRDDPVWRAYKPPRHWNCRCGRNPLTIELAAARGIAEAREWLRTGRPPATPAFVPWPAVELPRGWRAA